MNRWTRELCERNLIIGPSSPNMLPSTSLGPGQGERRVVPASSGMASPQLGHHTADPSPPREVWGDSSSGNSSSGKQLPVQKLHLEQELVYCILVQREERYRLKELAAIDR
ncbi:hypothetical protein KC352_g70 [Hortaea werneckii]|nr:hypothetical protein KC352_g70 [Hortaea werneckii]